MAAKSGTRKASSSKASGSSGRRGASRSNAPKRTSQGGRSNRGGRLGKGGKPSLIVLLLAIVLFTAQSVFNIPVFVAVIPVLEQISGQRFLGEGDFPGADAGSEGGGAGGNGQTASPGIFLEGLEYPEDIPEYTGSPYITVNENIPLFTGEEETGVSFEEYSPLDELGRCGVAFANIGTDLMPKEKRGSISSVKPTGWQKDTYDIVDGKHLYNRCHLIGYQLTGENANALNLITGTRYLNVEGMLPFEQMVADYIHETDNHVLYRVTPVFDGDNLVADGLFMEGKSVEDGGAGICFFIYAYNVQPGIGIDYRTGESWLEE